MKSAFLALSLVLAQLASASVLSISSGRFVVNTEGSHEPVNSGPLSLARPISPLNLTAQDSLRLTFTVVAKDEDGTAVEVVPHQTFLRFVDTATGEEGYQPVRVKSGGKAKFDLNVAKPPPSLPPTPTGGPVRVSLILGSYKHTSVTHNLFELYLPRTQPAVVHPEAALFAPQPAIHHTFRQDPKSPPRVISLFFALSVLSPWLVLVSLLLRIPHSLPHLFSHQVAPFVVLLAAFEGLLFTYWLRLKLPDVLLYGAILALPTAAAGKRALSAIVRWRLGEKP